MEPTNGSVSTTRFCLHTFRYFTPELIFSAVNVSSIWLHFLITGYLILIINSPALLVPRSTFSSIIYGYPKKIPPPKNPTLEPTFGRGVGHLTLGGVYCSVFPPRLKTKLEQMTDKQENPP